MTILPLLFQFGYILLPYFVAVARTSNTVLNRSGESEHPCLLPEFSKKVSAFTMEYYIGCEFVMNDFYYVEICSLCSYIG